MLVGATGSTSFSSVIGLVSRGTSRARRVNRGVTGGLRNSRMVTLFNKLNVNGATFAEKLTETLNISSNISDPAFTLMGRCDKGCGVCRFSVCEIGS